MVVICRNYTTCNESRCSGKLSCIEGDGGNVIYVPIAIAGGPFSNCEFVDKLNRNITDDICELEDMVA